MIHQMKLHDKPFQSIKSGSKRIEMRLNDEKRQLIKIDDIIEFTNITTNEKIKTQVIQLHKFANFEQLYNSFDKICLGYKENEQANSQDMELYYSKEEQNNYGVLGIEIKLIK